MRPGTSGSRKLVTSSTQRSKSRAGTPIEDIFLTSAKPYTAYPLYKQKVRSLLKPPDYSRQPPNFLSVRETRTDFERKEASMQVKILKKTFNMMREEFNTCHKRMSILEEESIRVNNLEHVGTHDVQYLEKKYRSREIEENMMLEKIRNEFTDNIVYKHVRERLRQTLMHLELKNQYLQDQIRLKDFLIDSEQRKKIKSLESKFTMVQTYKTTSKSVYLDVKDRTQDLNILEDDIKVREKIHELRQTRMKKYEEIAEAAAIEEGDLKSNSKREGLLLHMAWYKFLNSRMDKETAKNAHMEEAFKKMKAATTKSNPHEIVQSFLMKEERLSTLMVNLSESRSTCEKYRVKNEVLEKKIDDYILTQKEGNSVHIKNLQIYIKETSLKVSQAKLKLGQTNAMFEQVKSWVCKKLKRINPFWEYSNESLFLLHQTLLESLRIIMPRDSSFIADF